MLFPANFGKGAGADLAIGLFGKAVATADDAGAVSVLLRTILRPVRPGDHVWHQNRAGIPEAAEEDDRFGGALPQR